MEGEDWHPGSSCDFHMCIILHVWPPLLYTHGLFTQVHANIKKCTEAHPPWAGLGVPSFLYFFWQGWEFETRLLQCSPGWPGSCSVDQIDLELGDLPDCASSAGMSDSFLYFLISLLCSSFRALLMFWVSKWFMTCCPVALFFTTHHFASKPPCAGLLCPSRQLSRKQSVGESIAWLTWRGSHASPSVCQMTFSAKGPFFKCGYTLASISVHPLQDIETMWPLSFFFFL